MVGWGRRNYEGWGLGEGIEKGGRGGLMSQQTVQTVQNIFFSNKMMRVKTLCEANPCLRCDGRTKDVKRGMLGCE